MKRPHLQKNITDLEKLFEANRHNLEILEELLEELARRKTQKARSLMTEILNQISKIDHIIEPDNLSKSERKVDEGDSASGFNQDRSNAPVTPDRSAINQIPDDSKRPATLSLIRPVRTKGLPDAYVKPLDQSLELPADADLPDRFIAALQELIREIKQTGGGQKRYELEKGQRGEIAGGQRLYHFPFSDEAALFEGAQVEIQVGGQRIEGSLVSMEAGRLTLALKEDIGSEVRFAVLVIDATALLEALKERIQAVNGGEIKLNRALADAVVQPGDLPSGPDNPIQAKPATRLNEGQRDAYEKALREAVTFIWGPPGSGKTSTLSEIVDAAFEGDRRTLVCANTNRAVDQILYRICTTLGP